MDRLVALVHKSTNSKWRSDDDLVDRLSSKYTVITLIVFAVLVSLSQYVRNPITCWAPKQFHGSHTKFSTNYCWVAGTYYLPWEEDVLKNNVKNEAHNKISYYQWIPFILLGQALLFYFPSFVWHGLNSKSGVDADSILETAHKLEHTDSAESHNRILRIVTKQIDRFLSTRKSSGCRRGLNCLSSVFSKRGGSYLLCLFLFSKVLYIGNIVFQLVGLNFVLGARFSTFGTDMIANYLTPTDWTEEGFVVFPRVTLCDFRIRGQDFVNVQDNTVQCVLPVNMYNEKIYVFLWFWMVLVGVISTVSFIVWLARALFRSDRLKFIQNRLGHILLTNNDSHMVPSFVDYLGQDGALIVRLVAHNTSHITTTEIICDLWDYWKINYSRTPSTTPSSRRLYPDSELENMKTLKSLMH